VQRSVPHGNVAVARVMASKLCLRALLGPACRERGGALTLIISRSSPGRAVRPESKLSNARWWQAGDTTLGMDLGVVDVGTDEIYAAMDVRRDLEESAALREQAACSQARAVELSRHAARRLRDQGLALRDVGQALGVSVQRAKGLIDEAAKLAS
jgi:hypothetical protein